MHLKKFQTQLFMLFLSKVAKSQSPDVSFRLVIKPHVLYFYVLLYFYYVLLYFNMFYYILLYFTIFYYILLYFTIFYYIIRYFTMFYYIMLLLTNCEVHMAKYSERSFDVRTE